MTSSEMVTGPLVHFYDLSGPKPWSPACWRVRYALNYKRIPYTVTKLSYTAIKPVCETLLSSMIGKEGFDYTVPIIEILTPPYTAMNDSAPIARLLNDRFTEKDGYPELKLVDESVIYSRGLRGMGLFAWVVYDVWANALDKKDGSREYFRRTREADAKISLEEFADKMGGGEATIIESLRDKWRGLKERMAGDGGMGERRFSIPLHRGDARTEDLKATYIDFYDASLIHWIEAANPEKGKLVMDLYGDDTFIKLMKKVSPYET